MHPDNEELKELEAKTLVSENSPNLASEVSADPTSPLRADPVSDFPGDPVTEFEEPAPEELIALADALVDHLAEGLPEAEVPAVQASLAEDKAHLVELQMAPVPCACVDNHSLRPQHFFKGLLVLLVRCSMLAIILAVVWAFADGMRTFGISPMVLPFSSLGQYQPRMHLNQVQSPLMTLFDNFLVFYNCAFPGANRLGSGIGIIGGAFWALHSMPHLCLPQRSLVAAIAGALIGFRAMMMLSSSAPIVLAATILGALGISIYMTVADRKARIPELPLAKMY